MSRRQRLYSAVVSSYVQLGVSAAFTLGSVRLALDHLPRAHFGLWGLVLEITGVLLVLDFGLPAAFARLLIDEKDRKESGRYERLLYAALLFFALQGLVLLAVALVTLGPFPGWLGVDAPSRGLFRDVLIGQAIVAAMMCVGRYPGVVLLAHHRMDLANLGSAAGLAVNLGVLAWALSRGAGVMSFVHGSAAGMVVTAVFTLAACQRLGLRLVPSVRAFPTRRDAREVFGYGLPVMVINLGVQLIFFTRTTVVSRALGLDAAGVWAVCNRPFNLLYQLCWKPADMAFSLFSEMVARNEREHLRERFLEVFRGTLALTATAGVVYAASNQAFLLWWTGGKAGWSWTCDALLAVWLVPLTAARLTSWLIQAAKEVRRLPWVYVAEGCGVLVLGYVGARAAAFPGVIMASLVLTTLLSGAFGVAWARRTLGLDSPRRLFRAAIPAILLLGIGGPLAFGLVTVLEPWPPFARLVVSVLVASALGAGGFLWLGCTADQRRHWAARLGLAR